MVLLVGQVVLSAVGGPLLVRCESGMDGEHAAIELAHADPCHDGDPAPPQSRASDAATRDVSGVGGCVDTALAFHPVLREGQRPEVAATPLWPVHPAIGWPTLRGVAAPTLLPPARFLSPDTHGLPTRRVILLI